MCVSITYLVWEPSCHLAHSTKSKPWKWFNAPRSNPTSPAHCGSKWTRFHFQLIKTITSFNTAIHWPSIFTEGNDSSQTITTLKFKLSPHLPHSPPTPSGRLSCFGVPLVNPSTFYLFLAMTSEIFYTGGECRKPRMGSIGRCLRGTVAMVVALASQMRYLSTAGGGGF